MLSIFTPPPKTPTSAASPLKSKFLSMMAASVMASIPALAVFVALQRYLRGGLALGGLKG